ncbi:MAG: FtsX-like permease family protein, partial [Candidatus Zixiibacteriota bacterium]
GMRKVAGAGRGNIILQFYGESFIMSLVSLAAAVALIELLLPVFNDLVGKELTADFFNNHLLSLGLIGATLVTAVVSGFYPALLMSHVRPVRILKGESGVGVRGLALRKVLVVLQFALSVIMIVVSLVIFKQVDLLQTMDTGFDRENLVYFQIRGEVKDQYAAVKQELLQHPDILHVSPMSGTPLGIYHNGSRWTWEGKDPEADPLITYLFTDVDFPETFDIEIAQGRFYREEQAGGTSVSSGEIVINETLARLLGVDDAIGMKLSNYGHDLTVVGVIKNFHFKPMYRRVDPLILFHNRLEAEASPHRYNYMFVRIRPHHTAEVLTHIEKVYQRFGPESPFALRFFDEASDRLYASWRRTGRIVRTASAAAIFISCMGLLGLAAYTTVQRTQEIGIRKVLGASVMRIIGMLAREFLIWVIIANIIGGLLAYLFMSGWLQDFPYRTTIGWQPFAAAGLVTLLMAMAAVSYQAVKAAVANPVDTLRQE